MQHHPRVQGDFHAFLETAAREMRSTIARRRRRAVLFPWKMRQEIAETKAALAALSYANRRKRGNERGVSRAVSAQTRDAPTGPDEGQCQVPGGRETRRLTTSGELAASERERGRARGSAGSYLSSRLASSPRDYACYPEEERSRAERRRSSIARRSIGSIDGEWIIHGRSCIVDRSRVSSLPGLNNNSYGSRTNSPWERGRGKEREREGFIYCSYTAWARV